MPDISAAIFDWDKTLVDSMEGIRMASNYTFKKMRELGYEEVDIARTDKGYGEWTNDETQVRFFSASAEFFDTHFGRFNTPTKNVAAEALKIWRTKLKEIQLDHIQILDGAMDTLKLLANKGIPTAIVSNKDEDLLRTEAEEILKDFLGKETAEKIVIKGALPDHRGKPYPDPIFDALSQLNISAASSIWMIGDSISDVKAGIKSGSHGILFGEINRAALKALQQETDPEKQSVVVGKDVGFVDSHKDLQKLIKHATILPTEPYDPKNNPKFVCKHPAPKPVVKAAARRALRI